jgi:hypothetical protein
MAKRKDPKNNDTGMVKVVDPFYDSPEVIHSEADPEPLPPRPSVGQRIRRFFDFLLRLIASLIILGVIGLGLYYGLPLLYNRYIVPVEQNTAGLTELQSQQKQMEQELADLQSRMETVETGQSQNAEALTELGGRMDEVESEIAVHTESLSALEEMQSQLEAQDEAMSAELERQINLLKSMELMSRARLFMFQSNFGLARQDIKTARDLLMMVRTDAPEDLVDDLNEVIRRLDLVLTALPNFPVAARDDLDVAWQVLLLGLPQAQIDADGTAVPTVTPPATPATTFTPTLEVTVEPTAID